MNKNDLKLKAEVVLDKVKSMANIRNALKSIETKLSKIRIQGTLNSTQTKKELNTKLKAIRPKIKVDADTRQAAEKVKKLGQQNDQPTIKPTIDDSQVTASLKTTQKKTKSLFAKFSNNIVGSQLIRMSVQHVTQAIHQAISMVKELDSVKTNIQSASGVNDPEADAMMHSYNQTAQRLGSTTKDIGNAANEILRMGVSVSDTNKLIETSAILAKTGMIDSSQAAEYLISTMKGYQLSAGESMKIADKLTGVGKEAAVSAGGLAEAVSKYADTANKSDTSLERLIGYTAAIGETTQDSMSTVGNSLKSVYDRMNNIKAGKLIDDASGESLSNAALCLNKLGIQLRDTANNYRDFDAVLDDINAQWQNMTQTEQQELATALAGEAQKEHFTALMNNYADALKYSETAASSAGCALERYGVYQNSLDAKVNVLTASLEALFTDTVSEDLYGSIVQATTGIVKFLDSTQALKGTFAGLATLGISKMFVSMGAGMITAYKNTAQLTRAMVLFNKGKSEQNLKAIGAACKGLSDKQFKLVLSAKGLQHQDRLTILSGKGVEKEMQEETLATLGFSSAQNKAAIASFSLRGAFNALKTAIATNPIGAIATVISSAVMIFANCNQAIEEIREKAQELGSSFKETSSDIENYKTKISDLYNTINDSHSSIEDVTSARKTLMSVQDELIEKFGTEKDAINNITDAINGQTSALDVLTQKEWQATKNEFNNSGFWKGFSNFFSGYSNNIDRMLDEYENYNATIYLDYFIYKNNEQYDTFKTLLEDNFGATITSNNSGAGYSTIATLSGNATEVYEKLLEIQNLSDQFHFSDSFENELTNLANSARNMSDQYKDFYNQYILQEKILTNGSDYSDSFKNITTAYDAYSDAFVSGDESKIKETSEKYASTITDAMDSAIANGDTDVASYFENMYPAMQSIILGWKFNIAFNDNTDNLQTKVQSALDSLKDESGRALSAEEILGLDKENDQYQELQEIAYLYNMSLEEMIALLKERNLVSAMDYQELVGSFGQENIDKLSPEDLEIAYQIKNIGNMTFDELQTEIQKTKESAENKPISFSDQLTNSQDSLDKFQSSIKSAYDAYQTLLSEDYSSDDMLDSIQAISQAAKDMGKSINWEFIEKMDAAGVYDSMELLGGAIEHVSEEYAKSILSGAGIDINSSFGQRIAEGIIQAHKAEAEFNAMNTQIDRLQSSYQTLTGILDSYNETGHISLDNLQSLLTADENLIAMLEVENGQLVINQSAYENLIAAQLLEFKTKLNDAAAAEIEALAKSKSEEATNKNADASYNAVTKLNAETDAFGRNTSEAIKNAIIKAEDAGVSEEEIQGVLDKYSEIWNAAVKNYDSDFPTLMGGSGNSEKTSASSGRDTHLEEYQKKLANLQTMLDRELINQKEFYNQSDALLNEYLKDTPAHMQKYADEISSAEKTLRGNWISSFGYEKSQLEKDLSDSALVQWQYYEQLSELAEKYYNTEGASYGKFAEEYGEITREIKEGQEKLWDDIFSEVNSQLDSLQSACETVRDAIAEYSENGSLSIDTMQKLIALEPQYMAMLFDENGQLQLNAEAYGRLAKTKLEELKIDLAGQALNTINSLQSEAQAVEMLTGKYAELRDTSAGAIEQQLRDAVEEAYGRGEQQGKAAEMVLQAYVNQKKVLDATDLSSLSLTTEQKDNEADRFLKTFDWIGTLLERISDKTSKLIDKVNKFYSWQKKNSMINRAVKATDKELNQNRLAYQAYMKKADSVGLGLSYIRKVHNGTLSIEDITDEKTAGKIDEYSNWYDKAQGCLDTIEDLYDKQRDLIRQKLDNVLDYYSDMDSYLSSITSKIESVISLNDEMGKRTSLTELVEQFASVSDRLENATAKSAAENMTDTAVTEIPSGGSKKVAEAVKRDSKELADSIQAEIDNLDVTESGNYTRLLNDIAKTKAEIDKYEDKGWDKSKAKSYEKLQKKLQNYYDLQKALDENATSDTVGNYERIYKAWQKLRNKLDSGKTLSKSEQKRYDSYAGQLDGLKAQGQSSLDRLRGELAEADGTAPKQSEADRIKAEIDGIQSDLENSVTYQNLKTNIKNTENQIADFDAAGYDNLSKKQKQTYDRMQKQLKDYYAQKDALDEGATASSIAQYNKIYLARKKLQDKLDSGKNLSEGQWKQYNDYTKQLEGFKKEKSDTLSERYAAQEEALNPGDKREQIEKAYEESSKDIYESYQSQIDSINSEAQNSQQYKSLKAKAQKLEQKKDTKGLSKSEQASLDKYNAELEALQTGATGANIKDYMKTWESWYTLDQKLKKNGKLSDSDAKKYDDYKAKLEAWNAEKQTQINDLVSLMEDDLEQLDKTYAENISEAESEVNSYYANLYSLAKQIAEYNLTSLQAQLDHIESCISYYKELISLYDSFSGEKLTKLLTDLDETELADKAATYGEYLNKLQEKYDTTLSEINEYSQLLGALKEGDFEASTDLFRKAMEDYRSNGNDAMAGRLQSVLDLLNERAADAGDWDAYADEWALEWENALSAARQELIGTATQIQEVNDALREIRFENITDAIEELDRASGMLSSIESLIQDDWLFEPDGSLSEYGRAKAALLVSQLEDAQAQADAYLNLYNEIQNNKDTYASDKAYRSDLNAALQNYYDSLNSAASFENSIMDLMKKSAEEEINSLKDIIEARKKALQSKKEYYDYDKSIKNSQKEIDSLKAQIDALENLSGATDAAAKAKLAQLKAELAEKEDALQETKNEHTFNLQIDALDEFANSLTDSLDNSTKSVEEILKEQKEIVASTKDLCKASVDSTSEAIDRLTAFYGGMGASIDGTDYLTKTSPENSGSFSIRADGSVIYPENGNNENMIVSAVNETTSAVEQLKQETVDRLAALITNQELFRELIPELFSWENAIMPQLNDGISQLNKFIQTRDEAQPVVINNHYDSLINVEGNVDKEVADLLPKQLEQSYLYTTEHLFNGIRAINTNRSGRPFIL